MEEILESTVQIHAEIEHKTLEQRGCEIHYFVSGAGNKDLVVFLHPAFSDHRAFDLQIDYFSDDFCVITIDLIGHGLSKANRSKDKIDVSAEHISRIIDSEGFDSAHIIGVSMGSLVAQHFGFLFSDKARSLVALGGYNIHMENRDVQKAQMRSNLSLLLRAMFSMRWFRKRTARITAYSERGQALSYQCSSLYERRSFLVMQGFGNIIRDRQHFNPSYPTLILTGEHDIELAHQMAIRWYSTSKNSVHMIIKNAGHCANLDQPESFNRIVMEFVRKCTLDQ